MRTWFTEKFGESFGIRRTGFELRTSGSVLTAAPSSALSLTAGQLIQYDCSGAGFSVLLPAVPYDGLTFVFSENAGSANNLTIDGNGKNINGAATKVVSTAYLRTTLRYNGTQWITL